MSARDKLIKAGENLTLASEHIKSIDDPNIGIDMLIAGSKLDEIIREIKHILINYGDSDD